LRRRAEETARLWGCSLQLRIDHPDTLVSRATINELSLMIAEAVANAVRHGEARAVEVALTRQNDCLQIEVRDNGRGFSERASARSRTELAESELPHSLHARVRDLGGRMQAWTSGSGAVLRFEFPL
jgi:signal transduction histidine kinase